MTQLCRLYASVQEPGGELTVALDVLDELGTSQARAARGAVVSQAMAQLEVLDARSFAFVADYIRQSEAKLAEPVAFRLGQELWRRSPLLLMKELGSGTELADAAAKALARMPTDMLLTGLMMDSRVADELYRERSDVATMPAFWSMPEVDGPAIISRLDTEVPEAQAVLNAIVAAGRMDLAPVLAQRFGLSRLLEAVGALETSTMERWLESLRYDADQFAHALALAASLPKALLLAIARVLEPDSVPNAIGDDPWATAWLRSEGSLQEDEDAFMAAYFVSRGLGDRSRSPDTLLRMSFERAHHFLAVSAMPDEGWRLIDRKLGWVTPWSEWERCGRLREAVVARFVDGGLDPTVFGRLVSESELFHKLVDVAAKTGRGRRYLGYVHKTLVEEATENFRSRAKYIERVVL